MVCRFSHTITKKTQREQKQNRFSSIEVEKAREVKGKVNIPLRTSAMKKRFSRLSLPHALIIAQLSKENACFL